MHYKAFERVLVARIGPSISRRLALAEFMRQGGAPLEVQMALAEQLLAEANAYSAAFGALSRFHLKMEVEGGASVYGYTLHERSFRTVRIAEVAAEAELAVYTLDDFAPIVRALRLRAQPLLSTSVRLHHALHQWQLVRYSATTLDASAEAWREVLDDANVALEPLRRASMLLVGYAQAHGRG